MFFTFAPMFSAAAYLSLQTLCIVFVMPTQGSGSRF